MSSIHCFTDNEEELRQTDLDWLEKNFPPVSDETEHTPEPSKKGPCSKVINTRCCLNCCATQLAIISVFAWISFAR